MIIMNIDISDFCFLELNSVLKILDLSWNYFCLLGVVVICWSVVVINNSKLKFLIYI